MGKHKRKKKRIRNKQEKGNLSMTLYELNQSIISQLPPYTEKQINNLIDKIDEWDRGNTRYKYYMLLNNDFHYYTLFHYDYNSTHTDFDSLGKGVVILLQEMGYTIMSEEINEDHCEVWVKKDDDTVVYLLFPYDQGVVTYG